MKKWRVLGSSEQSWHRGRYRIVPIREQDMLLIKEWRNEQIDVLRQKELLSDEGQREYFRGVIEPLFSEEKPEQVLFSFLFDGNCIGYGGIVHIDWERGEGEVSFLVETERANDLGVYEQDCKAFFEMVREIAFDDLRLKVLTTECYDIRPHHVALLEQMGFVFEKRVKGAKEIQGKVVDALCHRCIARPSWNVLMTSISKKIPMIEALKDACRRAGPDILLFGADMDEGCLGKKFVDRFFVMPAEFSVEDIVSFCLQNGIRAIVPSRDGELSFFALHAPRLRSCGIEVMVGSFDTVEITRDKLLFYERLRSLSLPGIVTTASIEGVVATRYVVKERFGAGARGMALDVSKEEAVVHARLLEAPIFQPFIVGKEYSVDLYVDRSHGCRGVVVRSRDVVVRGESQVTTTVRHARIEALATQLVLSFKVWGHVVVQVIEDGDGGLHVVEMNCRFGGASTASLAVGLDSFFWFLLEVFGKKVPPFVRSSVEKRLVRIPKDVILSVE